MLVAYSMLQMVRKQVLQENMAGDAILLVRAPSGQAQPHRLLGAHDIPCHLQLRPWAHGVLGFSVPLLLGWNSDENRCILKIALVFF